MPQNWFNKPNIREKLLKRSARGRTSKTLVVLALLAAISLVSVFVFIHYSTESMRANVRYSLQQSVEQRRLNIDYRLQSMLQADSNLIPIIYPYMNTHKNQAEQYAEYAELSSILGAYTDNKYITNVRLYVPDSKIYSRQRSTFYPLSDLTSAPDADSRPYLKRPGVKWHNGTIKASVPTTNGGISYKNVITCTHSMRSSKDYNETICVLMLDLDIATFDELLSSDYFDGQIGYLVNEEGFCLASSDKTLLNQAVIPEGIMEQIQERDAGCLEQDGRVYVYHKLDTSDWYVVMDYPDSVLFMSNSPQSGFTQIMTMVVLIIALSMIFVLAYNFSLNMTLARISASLDALNTGAEKPPENPPQFLDPLHSLERNADQMVLTVKELMENRYKDQLAIAESQMKSLQAQIKPHFLYNTLDIIKWMILDGKAEDATWMVNSLSKYLRKSINKGPSIIPLAEELELSRTYLVIMQKRFENRFSVNYEIEEGADVYMIPKLSLQPLLENALLHGILYSEKPEKELTIRAWAADGFVHIEVEDNGNGMSEQTRLSLEEGTTGYGMANVRKRLELFGRSQTSFEIFSREDFGTCIAIRIPATVSKSNTL